MDAEERPEPDDEHCAACGVELRDDERGRPVCQVCDERLERTLRAWLDFAAVRDS